MKNTTISAISTPLGTGGIGVIRMSGPKALEISEQMFVSCSGKKVSSLDTYTGMLGNIMENDKVVDQAIVYRYIAPKSYTGEDVIEISCHGGAVVTNKILRLTFDHGAVPAEPGEFTKRAFLNGKMDLLQAEAVMDVISAQNVASLNAANDLREGKLSKAIDKIIEKILDEASHLAAWADYPEEDMEIVDEQELEKSLKNIEVELSDIISTFDYGQILKEGITTAIVGKPNVGKSSLMNLLVGQETSIVTDIPGTTRDVVRESIRLGDLVLQLSDTAGIRDTPDIVERVGVERAKKQMENAQLVLVIFDHSQPLEDIDRELIELVKNKPTIALVNKRDLTSKIEIDTIRKSFEHILEISAKESQGIEKLESIIKEVLDLDRYDQGDATIIFNERQRQSLMGCRNSIDEAVNALRMGVTLDAIGVCLDEALDYLMTLSGQKVQEEVVGKVFERFCVGK